MTTGDTKEGIQLVEADIRDLGDIVREHMSTLSFPMDSFLEDMLVGSIPLRLVYGGQCVGYAAVAGETLRFFYVRKEHFRHAPSIFETVIGRRGVTRALVMSQDPLMSALIAEWEFEKEKQALWFTDGGAEPGDEGSGSLPSGAVFRPAVVSDVALMREVAGGFLDEGAGGATIEDKTATGTLFVLRDGETLLGIGIIEKSRFRDDLVSIGMFTNPPYRRMGVARAVLRNLKQWAYDNGFQPVAGCWYHNTLSRRSLESAGMVATSVGYMAVLKGKEQLPPRTGNPPGEPADGI